MYGCEIYMKNNKDVNYLDYIPVKNNEYNWSILKDGIVEICVVNKGVFNTIAQKIFKRPRISKIKLDKYGSIVWKAIDNKKDIGEISLEIRNEFQDDEKVFYSRLIKFFQILKENKFIEYRKS